MAAQSKTVIYRETLATALAEFDMLSTEIEQLKSDLDRLESQRLAVEEICDAIQHWMHSSNGKAKMSAPKFEEEFPISTEEVALIARADEEPVPEIS